MKLPPPTLAKHLVWVVQQPQFQALYDPRRIIKWSVERVRPKVERDPADPRHIAKVHRVGYRFGE